MTLGDLEFKAEDFEQKVEHAYRAHAVQQLAQIITNEANRLLRERLEKATKIYGAKISILYDDKDLFSRQTWSWVEEPDLFPEYRDETHTARLVCVEEIKKENGRL